MQQRTQIKDEAFSMQNSKPHTTCDFSNPPPPFLWFVKLSTVASNTAEKYLAEGGMTVSNIRKCFVSERVYIVLHREIFF